MSANLSQSVPAIPLSRQANPRESGDGLGCIASTATAAVGSPSARSWPARTRAAARGAGWGPPRPLRRRPVTKALGQIDARPPHAPRRICRDLLEQPTRTGARRCFKMRSWPVAGRTVLARRSWSCMEESGAGQAAGDTPASDPECRNAEAVAVCQPPHDLRRSKDRERSGFAAPHDADLGVRCQARPWLRKKMRRTRSMT